MKNFINTMIYLSLLMLPLSGQSEIITLTDAIEADIVRINIDSSLNGYVVVKRCPNCPDIRLKINKHTQAIKKGRAIHLHRANQLNGKGATIIFDPKTKLTKEISW